MKGFKPLLAVEAPKVLQFPLYASAKLDGVRAVVKDAVLVSRSLKPIPNGYVQSCLGNTGLEGLDGELTVGPANDKNVMQSTTSGVMSHDGEPDFTFWVFDYWTDPAMPYATRLRRLQLALDTEYLSRFPRVKLLPQLLVTSQEELDKFEQETLAQGYEGVMLRKVESIYKFGRSTAREGHLLKLKRFADSEAVVIGFEELMHNANEATFDELGYTKRSSHADGKVPMATLGALKVRDCVTGIEFSIGTGYSAAQRQQLWNAQDTLLGKVTKYKHFEVGVKEAPRFPVWLGFRDPIDIGEPK